MNVLIVVAHPDDEVLGCGGTALRLAREGHKIAIAIMGEGETSRYAKRQQAEQKLVRELHSQCRQVAESLGADTLIEEKFPDNRFDSVPLLDIVKSVERIVEKVKPEVVFTHHGGDLNIDHVVVHRAVLTATRTMPGQAVRQIYSFEIPSSTEWAFQQFSPLFLPNVFIDITETIEEKIKAFEIYESEKRDFPHPRSGQAIDASGKRWGSLAGCMRAEPFQLIRAVIGGSETIFTI